MRYTYFEISNFKGIEHIRLELNKPPRSKVHTLVGLNESGKTTILEAINLLSYRESLDVLNAPGYIPRDTHELIPIAHRSNFNGKIVIQVGLELDDVDQILILDRLRHDHGITLTAPISPFSITQSYEFRSSKLIENQPRNKWTITLRGKRKRQTEDGPIKGIAWQKAVGSIKALLPRVVYFPNFLFEFPDRIYLENPPADEKKHQFYCTVLEDVLDAIGEQTNLDEHVLRRAKTRDEFDKKSLDSVLLKLGGHITKTVFSNWNKIFKKAAGKKEIVVSNAIDNRGSCYLQLRLKENNEYYEISERSLGFR